jgi:hypothetical protein
MSQLSPAVKMVVNQNPQTFERQLIRCFLHSIRFYRQHRDFVCPFDEENSRWRNDFHIPRYNKLYQLIDSYWRQYDDSVLDDDSGIPADQIEAMVVDQGNTGALDLTMAQELVTEIQEDFYRSTPAPALYQAIGPGVGYWLDLRVSKHLINKLSMSSQMGFLTLKDIEERVSEFKNKALIDRGGNIQGAREIAFGRTRYAPRIPCGLQAFNDALGGGFGFGETSLIAAANGCGKTVLASQLTYDFAYLGYRVALITTEQPPIDYIHRIISNVCNIEISEFINRKDFDRSTNLQGAEIDNIPAYLLEDPTVGPKIHAAIETMHNNVYCADWSQGQGFSILGNLENELESLTSVGWHPDIIIFDWIGGGLDKVTNKDHLRLYYQEAADYLVNHGKKFQRAIIAFAQLDKSAALNKEATSSRMLSECKTMTNNMTNFVGLSALFQTEGNPMSGTKQILGLRQFFNVEKARKGPGGLGWT